MNIWNVIYTASAEQDLRNIFEYVAYQLHVPETAKKLTQKIMQEIEALETMPFRYPFIDSEPWHSKGLRHFPVKNYLVFYLPIESSETVPVIRIMYGGRDIEKQLSETNEIT